MKREHKCKPGTSTVSPSGPEESHLDPRPGQIYHLRMALNLNFDRFALMFGVTSRTVKSWEAGMHEMSKDNRILFRNYERKFAAKIQEYEQGAIQ